MKQRSAKGTINNDKLITRYYEYYPPQILHILSIKVGTLVTHDDIHTMTQTHFQHRLPNGLL